MPTYPFWCNDCEHYAEDIRSMKHASDPMICDRCHKPMQRVFTSPQINMGGVPVQGYFNHGLGIQVNGKRDIKEYRRKYEGETGKELIELGNETLKPKKRTANDLRIPDSVVDYMASDHATVNGAKEQLSKVVKDGKTKD